MNNDPGAITVVNRALPFFNLAGLVLVLTANTLAVTLPLNGKTTGQLSDQYPNLFVPAGVTFSIWGAIYLLLVCFAIYQLMAYRSSRTEVIQNVNSINGWFVINCLANASWILAWHYEKVVLSVGIMLVLLISLIVIHLRLGIYAPGRSAAHTFFVQIPFSIYLGWIAIATIANSTALLVFYKWDGWGLPQLMWTHVMILTGALIALLMLFRRSNIYFALVVLWAYYGIIRKRQEAGDGEGSIVTTCLLAMLVIAISIVIQIVRNRKRDA